MTAALLVIGLLGVLWPVLAVGGGVWLIIWMISHGAENDYRRERAEHEERRALAARADEQNQLALAGDDRGIYGEWPPDVAAT